MKRDTAAAQTSMQSALSCLYPLEAGSIRLDGVDLQSLRLAAVRKAICAVPQDPILFSGSIRSNLYSEGDEGAAPPGMTYLHDVLPAPGAPPTPALLGKLGGAEAVQDEALLATPEVQAVVENPALHQLFAALLDTASVHALDYRWLRIVPPRQPSSFRPRSSSLLSCSA